MAKQRVQVAPLQATAAVRPTAAPVETYTRPAEKQVSNPLAEFVNAITPAIKADAEIKRQRQQQLGREVQAGIAEKQAFQAKIAVTDLLSESVNQYEQNKEFYLEAGPEKIAADRQAYFTDYLTKLEDAGTNPAIMTAIKEDLELGTVKFFADPAAGYNQAKATYDLDKSDAVVLNQITKITTDPDMPREAQAQFINSLVSDYFKTGRDKKGFNDKLMELADKQSGMLGETSLTDWLQSPESLNRFGVAEYADIVTRIKGNEASMAKKRAKAGEDNYFAGIISQRLASYVTTGQQGDLAIGTEMTHPVTGTTRKITAEDVQAAYEANNAKELEAKLAVTQDIVNAASPEFKRGDPSANPAAVEQAHLVKSFDEFYTPFQVMPTQYKNAISSGASVLTNSTGNPEKDMQLASQAFAAYRTVESLSSGLTKRSKTLKEDDLLRMRTLDILTGPAGREFDQALNAVQGDLYKDAGSRVTLDKMLDATDTSWWSGSKYKDVQNPAEVLAQFKDVVKALVTADGMSTEKAMELAAGYLEEDWLVVESTNGVKRAVPLLNTDIKQYAGQEKAAADYLNEAMLVPEINSLAKSIRGEGAGLSMKVNPSNPNAVDIIVEAEDGAAPPFVIDTVAFSELGTLSQEMMVDRLRVEANREAEFTANRGVFTTIDLADLGNLDDAEIEARTGITSDQAEALRVVRASLNEMIGISPEDEAIKAENEALMVLGTQAEAEASEADEANQVEEKPFFEVGEVNLMNAFTDMFKDKAVKESVITKAKEQGIPDDKAESFFASLVDSVGSFFTGEEAQAATLPSETTPSETTRTVFSDQTGKVVDMTGNTVAEKVGNLIKSQEGFKSNPYKDGKDRSVGYGFYLPALEPDELALIKDVENITQEEADAVMELKTRKISTFLADEITNFEALPEETQLGVISMAYQLGAPNLPSSWPSFMKAIKEAASAPEGSAEQTAALEEAAFNMLYNRKADGSTTKTKWYQQTPNRAEEMAAAVKG
jgi:GH24 family phage-related lysozyme (muramidase)